jgi:DNA invertase Pin-like site-specific DNA recombinase
MACSKVSVNGAEMEQKNDGPSWSRSGAGRLPQIRAAIHTRVSTTDQNSDLQLREIQEYVDRQGRQVVATYQDVISGTKASRPGLNRLMADAIARKFECLLVWKLDRFGSSLVDCLNNIRTLEDHGI